MSFRRAGIICREHGEAAPLNLYTFAAARGQFFQPDVRALLTNASVGLFSDLVNFHDAALHREAETLWQRLDVLLFGESSYPTETKPPSRQSFPTRSNLSFNLPSVSVRVWRVARAPAVRVFA